MFAAEPGFMPIWFILFFALLVLGGGALLLGLIVFALLRNRLGLAALVVGVALVGLLLCGAVVWSYVAMRQSEKIATPAAPHAVANSMNGAAHAAAHGLQNFKEHAEVIRNEFIGISVKLLLFVALVGFLIVIAFRRLMSPRPACDRSRLWPMLLVIPLIALLGLGGVRQASRSYDGTTINMPPMPPAYKNALPARQQALLQAQTQQQIAQADIHQLMDKVDAPRIPLSPPPAAKPAHAPSPTSAPKAPASASKAESGNSKADGAKAAHAAVKEADDAPTPDKSSSVPAKPEAKPKSAKKPSRKEKDSTEQEKPSTAATSVVAAKTSPGPAPAASPPSWINNPPKRVGEIWREVVVTDEYATIEECYRAADIQLQLATYKHLAQLVGLPNYSDGDLHQLLDGRVTDEQLTWLADMRIGIDYIRSQIARDEYAATTERSVGPMMKLYTLIEFTPAIDRELRQHWEVHERRDRFIMLGAGASSILALMVCVFGLLKIDTWTKGYYSKRLFLGVPAAIIGVWFLIAMFFDYLH